MSRYIDADALKEWLDEYLSVFKKYDKGTIKGFVDHAPSIDIVRCKECKWRGEEIESGNPYHWCRLVGVGYEVDDIHFCSYGQKGDENVETD